MIGECEGHDVVKTVHASWQDQSQKYRLVCYGAGPYRLETINPETEDVDWRLERSCYTWGVLCDHIRKLHEQEEK